MKFEGSWAGLEHSRGETKLLEGWVCSAQPGAPRIWTWERMGACWPCLVQQVFGVTPNWVQHPWRCLQQGAEALVLGHLPWEGEGGRTRQLCLLCCCSFECCGCKMRCWRVGLFPPVHAVTSALWKGQCSQAEWAVLLCEMDSSSSAPPYCFQSNILLETEW